ncbi:hypothetical protein HKD37_01G001904 [Glycine soja]
MDPSIVDTAITSRKRKREEYKKIILLAASCVVHMVIGVVTWYHNNYFVKEPTRNWELECHSFLNRLYRGTYKDCIEQLRLTMFLHILAHKLKYRVVQFSYCRSKETISRKFNDVLRAVMKVSKDYLNFQSYTLEGAKANKWRWFEICIGALDGTHIPIIVPLDERPRYRNRKGDVTTNVLATCGPDSRFIYVLPGWEGSAGDSRFKPMFVDEELGHQSREGVQNNVIDDITTIQAMRLTSMESSNEKMMGKRKVLGKNNDEIRSYVTWNLEIERVLAYVLRDQRNLGNKGDGDWKSYMSHQIMSKTVSNYGDRGMIGFDFFFFFHSHKSTKPFRFKIKPLGHGTETAMDVDGTMSRETNEVEFMGLGGATTTIDLEEPNSNTKGKRQGSTSSGTHSHERKMGEK